MTAVYFLVFLIGLASGGLLEFNGTFEDYFLYSARNQVDHSVDPCDDFYSHVCPKTMQTTAEQYSRSIIKYAINEGKNLLRTPLPISDIERLYKALLPSLPSDPPFNSVGELARWPVGFLKGLRNSIYVMEFMRHYEIRPKAEYKFLQKLVHHMLTVTQKELDITNRDFQYFEETAELGNILKNMVIDIGLQEEQRIAILFLDIQSDIDEIFNNHFNLHNISIITELDVVERQDEFGRIISDIINPLLFAMSSFDDPLFSNLQRPSFNAMNAKNDIIILDGYLLPATMTSKAAKYGYLGGVLGHEMMHSFFNLDTFDRADLVAKKVLCSLRHIHRVDEEFNTINRNRSAYYSFIEDTADHEGSKLAYKAFLEEFGDSKGDNIASGVNITNQQMFFYAWAAGHCDPTAKRDHFFYSPSHVRVNSAVSLINGFHETFHCKEEDRMKRIAHGESCHLLGNPVR